MSGDGPIDAPVASRRNSTAECLKSAQPQPHEALADLAAQWATDAGMSLSWYGTPGSVEMLTHPSATSRALWRCCLQVLQLAADLSGQQVGEVIAQQAARAAAKRDDVSQHG